MAPSNASVAYSDLTMIKHIDTPIDTSQGGALNQPVLPLSERNLAQQVTEDLESEEMKSRNQQF